MRLVNGRETVAIPSSFKGVLWTEGWISRLSALSAFHVNTTCPPSTLESNSRVGGRKARGGIAPTVIKTTPSTVHAAAGRFETAASTSHTFHTEKSGIGRGAIGSLVVARSRTVFPNRTY